VADWGDYAALAAADADGALSAEELERLAVAAFLLGRDGEVPTVRERAFEAYLARGLVERAAECGFWLGFHLDIRGDVAQAAGWAARVPAATRGRCRSTSTPAARGARYRS
jgi:hypothetical protein